MEKWRSRVKSVSKEESVLPPTRRKGAQSCIPGDRKKDKKWSFGGLFRKISSSQYNEVSSNDEDITYIPGHMLTKKQTKRTSRMRSKLGKIPARAKPDESRTEERNDNSITESEKPRLEKDSEELRICKDSVNSPSIRSGEGSLDATDKSRRLNKTKARAQAKRDRLCAAKSSSDEDSHSTSQSSMRFRSEDCITQSVQRSDSYSRRTRGARTERYIKRMYRDETNSASDSRILQTDDSCSNDSPFRRYSSNPIDSTRNVENRAATSLRTTPIARGDETRREIQIHHSRVSDHSDRRYPRDTNENETRDELTWPQSNFSRTNFTNAIYGSLRSSIDSCESRIEKTLPPEPPPRSSKSRIFTRVYNGASLPFGDLRPRYCRPNDVPSIRSYNSDNDILLADRFDTGRSRCNWENSVRDRRFEESICGNENCNSLDRTQRDPSPRHKNREREERDYEARSYLELYAIPSANNIPRTTSSLPKGVELFSRQRLANCDDPSRDSKRDRSNRRNVSIADDSADAERKRSSKNLEDALTELEEIYNSLRLSDEDLLERAEQRSMEEYRNKAAISASDDSYRICSNRYNDKGETCDSSGQREIDQRMKDDMAYRRMNPKERPSSVNGQTSLLPQISYLATSPNLSIREIDCTDRGTRSRRGTPDLTRDDLLFRSINHANNKLRVIEPQPPFGIPLGPVSGATESDYLHVKPSNTSGQTRSLYIPKNEPDVVSDDLAFRNLRKDTSRDKYVAFNDKNTNLFNNGDYEPRYSTRNPFALGTNKKRAVRSLSADLWGFANEDYEKESNWFAGSPQSGAGVQRENNRTSSLNRDNWKIRSFADYTTKSLDASETLDAHRPSNTLDINGNRPKCALQRKIQVHVPQDSSYEDDKRFSDIDEKLNRHSRNSVKSMITESEDSSLERCDSRRSSTSDVQISNHEDIEQFTDQEISSYQKLCQDLEKLIKRTAEKNEEEEEEEKKKRKRAEGYNETLGTKKDGAYEDIAKNFDDTNSQSEFDEWEKLLNEDYELPVSITRFDEINEINERDDSSSSRSAGPSLDIPASSSSSPRKSSEKCHDEDFSSTSEVGNGSNNGSLTDSVYDKFDKLLREVDDVPHVECTNKIAKYPTDELTMIIDNLGTSMTEEKSSNVHESRSLTDESNIPGVSHVLEYRTKVSSPSTHLDDISIESDIDTQNVQRHRKTNFQCHGNVKEESIERIDDDGYRETSACRQGEIIEDERACNMETCAFKDTSMHSFRNNCHVTNSITINNVVMCSFFLTLLITIIVAQWTNFFYGSTP